MRKLAVLLTLVLFSFVQTFAQTNRTVTGKVTDDAGNPLAGVTVSAAGTAKNAITDAKGVYTIQVPANTSTLKFSSVGFGDIESRIGSRTTIDVNMISESKALSEVVVVGYGVQQKKAFTGSSSKIDTKQFSDLVTPSIDKQLGGRAAGVQVANTGGGVGTPARIRIRGVNSISGTQDPLVVVDGVPFISGNLAAATNSNTLADINPNDIENIEILKDGSATAIFGSRAANGVIMITTKKGTKDGRMKVNYDATVGFTSPGSTYQLLNADQFVMIANEKRVNAGLAIAARPSPTGTNTDWQSVVLNQNALSVQHNLSFSGGTAKSTYFFSLNYSDQKGIIISNNQKAYRLRFNFETEVNKYVKVGNNLTLSKVIDNDQNNGTNALSGAMASALRALPNVDPYNSANVTGYNIQWPLLNQFGLGPNTIPVDDNYTNPAFTLNINQLKSDKLRLNNNAFVEISPIKGLKFRSSLNFDLFNDYSFFSNDPRHGDGFSSGGSVGNDQIVRQRLVWQNFINYNKSFGSHNLYLTVGQEAQKDQAKSFGANLNTISDIFFQQNNIITGTGALQFANGSSGGGSGFTRSGFQSLFGRVNYDFANKYFFQASVRRDGQSSLAPETRFGVFPGFSGGWRISQEKFWDKSTFLRKYLSDVKIKASYAIVGNALGGFPYLSTFSAANYGNLSGLAPNLIGNRSLQWERSKKYDIGAEVAILNGRFNFGFDWFLNDIDNLVLAVPTPPTAGIPGNSISQNIGTQRNRGVEITFGGELIRSKDFSWNFSWNHTNLDNKITSLYTIGGTPVNSIPGSYNTINVGSSLNVLSGYQFAGVNTANGNPMYFNGIGQLVQHNIANGAYYFATGKNDPTLGVQTALGLNDRKFLGLSLPTYFGGITNTFRYKQFSLDFMLRYSGGNKVMNITRQEALLSQNFHNNGVEILDRWTTPGQVTNVPRLVQGQSNNINQNGLAVSRFVESGDFIRLQNVSLSYTYDSKRLSEQTNGYIKTLRFFMQGQNMGLWTKYTGLDPENASQAGQDNAVSPQLRTVSFGVNVGF
ncbi:MAG: SusC/RagA family TonB-linked outer membrane protein [Sphingobacteriia bacterium]|jgi:TonB-linked SusC/RagA family outer membrane protein